MTSPLSLPTIIIFEQHWDPAAKQLTKKLLPQLAPEGYTDLCFEISQNITEAEILKEQKEGLEFDLGLQKQALECLSKAHVPVTGNLSDWLIEDLTHLMHLYVSSKNYVETAETIKNLPSQILMREIFTQAVALSINIAGVDIDQADYDKIISTNLTNRMAVIRENEELRIQTHANNLTKLRSKRGGVIYICGAIHADNILAELKKRNLSDCIVYCSVHSGKQNFKGVNDIDILFEQKSLKDHFHILQNDAQVIAFAQKILEEIKQKNTKYIGEIPEGNTRSAELKRIFNVEFKVFERPGHYVDALLDIDHAKNIDTIIKKLTEAGIKTKKITIGERTYLVIPEINTEAVYKKFQNIQTQPTQ